MALIAVEKPKARESIFGSTPPLDERAKIQKMLKKIKEKRGGDNDKKKTQTGGKAKKRKGTKERNKKTRLG